MIVYRRPWMVRPGMRVDELVNMEAVLWTYPPGSRGSMNCLVLLVAAREATVASRGRRN